MTMGRVLRRGILLAVLCVLPPLALADEPTPREFDFVGPRDVVGWVHRLVFDPADPQIVFAACDDTMGMYRSEDGGQSFSKVLAYGEGIDSWALDLGPLGRIYAGDHFGTGIRVSGDGGETFVQAAGDDLDYISAIDAHPTLSGIAFASIGLVTDGDGQGGQGPPLSERGFVVKTTDGGLNWEKLGGGLPTDAAFRNVWIHPGDPEVMLAGRTLDIWRSDDGGVTWQQLDLITPIPLGLRYIGANDFAASPTQPDRILASAIRIDSTVFGIEAFYEIWKSEDRGLTFEVTQAPLNTWLPYYGVVASPANDLFYAFGYVDSGHGILEARNNQGAEWQVLEGAPPHAYFTGAFPPDAPGEMIVSAFGVGLYRYREGHAEPWTHEGQGLAGAGCVGFALLEGEPERWIAGCGNVGLQPVLSYSDDYGASWTRVQPEGLEFDGWTDEEGLIKNAFLPLLADRSEPGVVLLGGDRIQRSTDRGESWIPVSGTEHTYDLTQGPDDAIYSSGISSVFRSTDHGQSFSLYGLLPCPGVRVRTVPDPVVAERVYAICDAEDVGVDGFYRRDDAFSDWVRLSDPPAPEEEQSRYISIDTFTGHLAAGTTIDTSKRSPGPPDERFFSSSVWVSTDDGLTWSDRTPPMVCAIAMSVVFLPDQAEHLLVGGFSSDATCPGVPGRLWESFDSGLTWRDATANLATPSAYEQGIHLDPTHPGGIFLATYYNGFYRWIISPAQVSGLGWEGESKSEMIWSPAEDASSYDIARGPVVELLQTGSFAAAEELACRQAENSATDSAQPAPGEGFYYLVRARRGPDLGSWGSSLRDETLSLCP